MREADVLLCPMLSPHTSYPVLEMAACRGIAVTNSFGSKTVARLQALSSQIVAGPPEIAGLAAALLGAGSRVAEPGGSGGTGEVELASDWGSGPAGDAGGGARDGLGHHGVTATVIRRIATGLLLGQADGVRSSVHG